MKSIASLICLFYFNFHSFGQSYSITLDSLTKTYIDQLPKSKQNKFDSILKQRLRFSILNRIDTSNFDMAFIEESYCSEDTSGKVLEMYFRGNDTIPKILYTNGYKTDVKDVYNRNFIWYSQYIHNKYTLNPLIKNYNNLKPNQELFYEKKQIWSHGCVVFSGDKSKFKKDKSRELKTTYCIMTMIDKINNRIIVSIQTAPSNPKFEIVGYNAVWDF